MNIINFSQKTISHSNKILVFLFCTFPIAIISGNLLTNTYIILIGLIYFLFHFKLNFLKNKIFIILNLFFLSLIINLFFSQNIFLSYPRVLKFLFIIYFILSFGHLINLNESYDKTIFKVWTFIMIIFTIDLLIEFYFGQNILGNKSYMYGRLSGFFGDELIAGYFYSGFIFFGFVYIYKNYNLKIIFILSLFLLIIFVSLVVGERSNFIKLSLGLSLLTFIIIEIKTYKKILFSSLIILCSVAFISSDNLRSKSLSFIKEIGDEKYYVRYYEQLLPIFQKDGFDKLLKETEYGAHYDTAYKIFERNKLFGVGIKNFRLESSKPIYYNKEYFYTFNRSKTHPHQIHFELLSETGLFGYISFLALFIYSFFLSIKNYLVFRNFYQLCAMIFILVSFIPYLPSGSFYSSFNSSIFWLNYAIMMGSLKKN